MPKDPTPSDAARALSRLGAEKGGRARASVLTDTERSDIARNAARTRWDKGDGATTPRQRPARRVTAPPQPEARLDMPISAFRGSVDMHNLSMECHVLDDGRRVLTAREVVRVLTGTTSRPASINRYLERLPTYDEEMLRGRTIQFRVPGTPQVATGYEATLLIEICDLYLKARDEGVLKQPSQRRLAETAEIVVRACAKVGIIALIDEATGYQKVREKRALQIKLQAFIAEDMQEWVATFPEEFWIELARLEGVRYSPRNRPLRWGKYVMRFVYDSIDPDLGKKLRQINPDPRHRHNHHQWLREYGRDKLHRQLGGVIAIMKDCRDMDEFRRRFDKVFAQYPQLELDLDLLD